jgi:glutamate carboxypeptidase
MTVTPDVAGLARGYAAALADERDAIVALTRELVEIDSPTSHHTGVAAVTQRLAAALDSHRIPSQRIALEGCGPLLEAQVELGTGRRVLLLGHADTVWPVGTAARWPFQTLPDGRLTGPGVGDMKVCLATAVFAIAQLARTRPEGLGALTLLVVPDEEAGSTSSRPLIEQHARTADLCLTLEAARPGGGIVTSRGAVGAITVQATGHAQHTTDPTPRSSALVPLARLVDQIEANPGATIGQLTVGTARQIVPAHGQLLVDLRAPTTEAAEALAQTVRDLVAATPTPNGVRLTVHGGVTRPAWPASIESNGLFTTARTAAAALEIDVQAVTERGGSDASFPGALGIPTLDGLGPTCHNSCSRQETVHPDDIPTWGAILATVAAAGPTTPR